MYPKYNYINNIVDADHEASVTSRKLRDLGWEPRKLEETLSDSVAYYAKEGLIWDVAGNPCRLPYLVRAWQVKR
uniref:Uncharacterized protein n=1 Tax=Arundo donax TaxID=35708 RepID=A0A0A9T0D0_ARUDO